LKGQIPHNSDFLLQNDHIISFHQVGSHMFSKKTLLITGGTGSFGNALVNRFINSDIQEIRILSRDEKKQDAMRRKFKNEKIRFFLGDTRDRSSLTSAINGSNYIFHAAALKQVPSCEFFPIEAVKTNILGSENVIDLAILHEVEKVICLSTDKAVQPVNAMGMTKALMEKVLVSKAMSLKNSGTVICGTRYGNVMASRGSVIPLFLEQIQNNQPLTITNPKMTRFMMSLEDAINLVLFAFQNGRQGDIFVQKSPGASIETVAHSVLTYLNKNNHKIEYIGERHGEKMHEVLVSKQELSKSTDLGDYFRIAPDDRGLNYEQYFETGQLNLQEKQEYSSDNTHQLSVIELVHLMGKLGLENLVD
jgi:UDP-N-acetylglucosamine 4,6-dehydratase/5-epimerase